MHHGCYHRCPKIREQLRKAREKAGEEDEKGYTSSESDLSDVADPSKAYQSRDTRKRSKESTRRPPGTLSPTKSVRTPRRSHESAYNRNEYPSARGSPGTSCRFDPEKRSQRRSKESQRQNEFLSSRGSPDPSRRFDPDKRSHRRSQESGRKSPRSIRYEQRDPHEYRSGLSTRIGSRDDKLYEGRQKKEHHDRAGPSRMAHGSRDFSDEFDEDDEISISAHDNCDDHCRGINERMKKIREEKERKDLDDYLLYKGLPYFGDLCTCCYQCLAKQLWNDDFVRSTVTSAALFAVGLKLCSELNGWTIPNAF